MKEQLKLIGLAAMDALDSHHQDSEKSKSAPKRAPNVIAKHTPHDWGWGCKLEQIPVTWQRCLF